MQRVRRRLRTALRVAAWTVALAPVFSVGQVLASRFVDPMWTSTMAERAWTHLLEEGELAWVDYQPRDWPLDHPAARAAVSAEDARFFVHRGFDWEAVCGAAEKSADGGKLRGGSTISQQVAKNVFLWQERSWLRKGLEVWYTFLLELLLPKQRILELYLNVAETGPMTFGFEAGAQHWYGKRADSLSADQARRLAAILPSPNKWSPKGGTASSKAAWIASHPAPFPGDRDLARVEAAWQESPGPLACVTAVAALAAR